MSDARKTKKELIAELTELRQRVEQCDLNRQSLAAEVQQLHAENTALVNNMPFLVWLKDINGVFISVNDAYAKTCGFSATDIVGRSDYDIWPEELAEQYRANDVEVIHTGIQKFVEEPIMIDRTKTKWFETFRSPIVDAEGFIVGTTGWAREISEREQGEQRIMEQTEFFNKILNALPLGVFAKNAQQDYQFSIWNDKMEEVFGNQRQDILGKSDYDFFQQEEADYYRATDMAVMDEGKMVDIPLESMTTPHGMIFAHTIKIPLYDRHGEPELLLNIIEDITKRQEIAEALSRRAIELEAVSQIGAATSRTLANDDLLQVVVDLTQDLFELYHVQIYLLDEAKKVLVLAAGSGQVGREMVAEKHYISLEQENELPVQVMQGREGMFRNNVYENPDFAAPLQLPNIRAELVTPMIVGDMILGVLSIQSDEVGSFVDEDVRIQSTLATLVAVAIKNNNLHDKSSSDLAKVESGYLGSDQVIHALTIEQILQALIESTALQQLDRANVLFFDRAWDDRLPEFMTVAAAWEKSGEPPRTPLNTQHTLSQLPGLDHIGRDAPTIFADVTTDDRIDDNTRLLMFERTGLRSMVIFPLVTSGQWIGVITGQCADPVTITEDDIRQITNLIDQAAAVIQNQRLFDQTQAALAETELLYDMTTELNATQTLDETLQATISAAVANGANYANLFVIEVDEHNQPEWIELRATWGRQGRTPLPLGTRFYIPEYPGGSLWLDHPDEPFAIGDIFNDPRMDTETQQVYQQVGAQATITLPLRIGSDWIGLIGINWPTPQTFLEKDLRLYKSLAAQSAVLINSKLLLEQAQRRIEREQLVNQITQKIQGTVTVEAALRTAVQELGRTFQAQRTEVVLQPANGGPSGGEEVQV